MFNKKMYELKLTLFANLANQLPIVVNKFKTDNSCITDIKYVNLNQKLNNIGLYSSIFIDFDLVNISYITFDFGFCHGYLLRSYINKKLITNSYDDCHHYCSTIEIHGYNNWNNDITTDQTLLITLIEYKKCKLS